MASLIMRRGGVLQMYLAKLEPALRNRFLLSSLFITQTRLGW